EGAEDDVLPPLAAGHAHRQGHGRNDCRSFRRRAGSRRLLARKSGKLRGLTLRRMTYPAFYEMYRAGIRNTWTVEEVDFSTDTNDLERRMTDAERHLGQ